MPLTSVIDHQPFIVLLDDQRGDERRQLACFEQKGSVSGTARSAARHHLQMGARERLVYEHTAWFQHIGECLEQGTIEKTDADDRVERPRPEWQRARIRHDAEDMLMPSHRGSHRAMDEVHEDDGSAATREGFGVAPSPSSKVEDEGVHGQIGAALDDPRRRDAVRLALTPAVPRVPLIALVARIVISAH